MNNLIILGAGGYAQQVLWTARREGKYNVIGFFNEMIKKDKELYGLPVTENINSLLIKNRGNVEIICAVGDVNLRRRWHDEYKDKFEFACVIDPTVLIAPDSIIGKDVVILAYAVCSTSTVIGNSTNINWHSVVAHEVHIGDFSDLALGVRVAGRAQIGSFCRLGANVSVIPDVKIGNNSIIGAGAVVVSNIPDNSLAVGVPAVVKKTIQ